VSRPKPFYALIIVLLLPGLLAGCVAETKCGGGGCPGDAQIAANVRTQFSRHSDLEGVSSINVQTLDHVVYLTGEVNDGLMKETAESIARKVPGVARVENSIAVIH
jgi:osmotically-inducible protein OsmY